MFAVVQCCYGEIVCADGVDEGEVDGERRRRRCRGEAADANVAMACRELRAES